GFAAVLHRGLALWLLCLVDEHRRYIILDRIPPPAFGAHDAIPLLRDGRLAGGTGEDLQQLLVDHILALLSAFIHSTVRRRPSSSDTRGRHPKSVSARRTPRQIRCTSPGTA